MRECICDNLGDCIFCVRKERSKNIKKGYPQYFYIAVYGISRIYLGPEEGGSWADQPRLLELVRVKNYLEGIHVLREIKQRFPQPKYNRFSSIGGEDVEIDLIPTIDFLRDLERVSRRYE